MTWLKEFGQIVGQASLLNGAGDWERAAHEAADADDPERLLAAFPGGATIDDPRAGRVEGHAALKAYGASSAAWLGERKARARAVATTVGRTRSVGEFDLELTHADSTFVLPVAVVVEPDLGRRAASIRIYHSLWPLLGHHVLRPPLLGRDPAVAESDIVGAYQAALAAGDAQRIVATFEPDGCFREPAGPQYRVCGSAALDDFFGRFFSAGGGILLEHCTVTEDGVRTALEFNAVKWGDTYLSPQAGIAVYERGPSGKIREARIYDDVQGPVEG
jgi:SnoaL-like domain